MKHLVLSLTLLATPALAGPVVAIDTGKIEGVTEAGVSAFKAIPFAAPPTGADRWRAPQPAAPWTGVRDASQYAHDCAQNPFPGDAAPLGTKPDEDCLYANVWTPASAKPGAKLPVMVWIYGGGFVNGGASPAVYSGAAFARDGVIMVSFNYRLGRFGFFAHPALASEGGGGNFAFMDQVAALKWVKRNVAAFGGDPGNVTVFGESAGGMSVHFLLTSPAARGLYQKAIVESGAGRDGAIGKPTPTLAEAAAIGKSFTDAIGVSGDAAALRALSADRIVNGLSMMTMTAPGYSGAMIDNKTLWETPFAVESSDRAARVPVIVGANSADGFGFALPKSAQFAAFGAKAGQAAALYDPDGTRAPLDLATHLFADKVMVEPARAVARILSRHQPIWLYRFDYVATSMRGEWKGAPHATEIPYVMDTVKARYGEALTVEDQKIASLTHVYWVNFAKTGKPDAPAAWPTYAPAADKVHRIGGAGAEQADDLKPRLDFMEGLAK